MKKFLIASDAERTTFLARLNESGNANTKQIQEIPNDVFFSFNENELNKEKKQNEQKGVDYTEVMNAIKNTTHKQPVMKEILRKLDEQTEAVQSAKE